MGYVVDMTRRNPTPIEKQEAATRRQRIGRTARSFGFRGRVEYRHVYSQTGGAQFCLGPNADVLEGVGMIGKKKLSDVRRELTELLERLPNEPPESWLEREIQAAEGQPGRDAETLKMLRSALQQSGKKKKGAVPTRS